MKFNKFNSSAFMVGVMALVSGIAHATGPTVDFSATATSAVAEATGQVTTLGPIIVGATVAMIGLKWGRKLLNKV